MQKFANGVEKSRRTKAHVSAASISMTSSLCSTVIVYGTHVSSSVGFAQFMPRPNLTPVDEIFRRITASVNAAIERDRKQQQKAIDWEREIDAAYQRRIDDPAS